MLSRDQILGAEVPSKIVAVADWGGDVRVRLLTAADRLRISGIKLDGIDPKVAWIVAACVDLDGKPVFTAEDIPALMLKGAKAIDVVYAAISEVNGLGVAGLEAARKN